MTHHVLFVLCGGGEGGKIDKPARKKACGIEKFHGIAAIFSARPVFLTPAMMRAL